MRDASFEEHLAPVSYLPWVQHGAAAVAAPVDARPLAAEPVRDAEPDVDWAERSESADPFESAGPSESADPFESAHPFETAEPSEPAERAESDETGAERDARIDRLVVGRLRRSSLSEAEVRSVLVEHGLDDVEVEEWIERYVRFGYLDDARLAEQVVHAQAVRRGRGSAAVVAELSRRGVDRAVSHEAIAELDPDVERANAIAVAERRARQLTGLAPAVAERRLHAFLQRRGYPSDVIRDAVATALGGRRS